MGNIIEMKRNLKVKKNVDDMIYQVLNYIDYSKLPEAEAELLVYEILSTIVLWNCDWNPENIDMNSLTYQVTDICTHLPVLILKSIEDQVKIHGYRETGE